MLAILGGVVLVLAFILMQTCFDWSSNSFPLELLDDGSGNEALIIEGTVCGERVLFMIDTAYAGAPVLSVSYMNAIRKDRRLASSGNVKLRFMKTMDALEKRMTNHEMHETLNEYVSRGICRTFTSGCTMRLMGIGETSETQAEMLLCPPILLAGRKKWHWDADVFVTNALPGSLHILTSDYLLHHGPALLEPEKGSLTLRASIQRKNFDIFDVNLVGGAFVIPVQVAGITLNVVIDTGASTTLSISQSKAEKIKNGCEPLNRKVYQSGVNGENICSDVVRLDVVLGSTIVPSVDILVNSKDVEGADGYIGIGILRAFDLYLCYECVGIRPNRL